MDQNEIDRMAQGIVDSSTTESKPAAAPSVTERAEPEAKTEMIDQLDKVTQVAEQETNKVLLRMESILGNLGSQAELLEQVKEKMGSKGNAEIFCGQLDQCLQLGQQSQDLIFERHELAPISRHHPAEAGETGDETGRPAGVHRHDRGPGRFRQQEEASTFLDN